MEIFYTVLLVCISCCITIWLLNRPKVVVVEKETKPQQCTHDFALVEQLSKNTGKQIGRAHVCSSH